MYDLAACAILGDEMGLGKTIQTITFLGYLKEIRGEGGPHLIVCPLSVMSSWEHELNRWMPSMRVKKLHAATAERQEVLQELADVSTYDVALTTYGTLTAQGTSHYTSRIQFRTVVLDEGHCIKNEETQMSGATRKLHCKYV